MIFNFEKKKKKTWEGIEFKSDTKIIVIMQIETIFTRTLSSQSSPNLSRSLLCIFFNRKQNNSFFFFYLFIDYRYSIQYCMSQ